jgi:GntR family transcriptional regulator
MTAGSRRGPPAYRRAQDAVLALVQEGCLGPGARVPSERDLASRLGLSRMTVRQGMENLIRAGILARDSTNGTRVADVSVVRVIDSHQAYSMSDVVRRSGARPGSRLLTFAPGGADRVMADRLDIASGATTITIRRLRTADDRPICIETTCIAADLVPGLAAQDLAGNASLYSLLQSRYGLQPTLRESEISITAVTPEDARLLELDENINVLLYRSLVRSAEGMPIEAVNSVNHPERVRFVSHFPQIAFPGKIYARES